VEEFETFISFFLYKGMENKELLEGKTPSNRTKGFLEGKTPSNRTKGFLEGKCIPFKNKGFFGGKAVFPSLSRYCAT